MYEVTHSHEGIIDFLIKHYQNKYNHISRKIKHNLYKQQLWYYCDQ